MDDRRRRAEAAARPAAGRACASCRPSTSTWSPPPDHAEPILPGPFRDRIYRPQGWLSPVLLVGGRMDGVWRHERKGRRLAIAIEPFARLPKAVRTEAEAEAERLAAFLGGEPEVSWA